MTELPKGWVATTLGEICGRISDGSHNPPKKQDAGLPMLSAININNNSINFDSFRMISEREFEEEDKRTQVSPGDVLLTIVGAIGRSAVVPERIQRFTLQRSVAVIRSAAILPKLLMHHLEEPRTARFFRENARGTAQKGVYLKTLASTPILLAPTNEQRRIVARIEAMFDEIDHGVESLKKAKATLGLYRQSLLKAAFEGRLTADWRAQNPDKLEDPETLLARIQKERETRYKAALEAWQKALIDWRADGEKGKKPAKPKPPTQVVVATHEQTVALPTLPYGWLYFTVGSLCEVVRGGSPRPAGDKRFYDGDIPFLKVADLTRTQGHYVRQFSYTITEAGLTKTRLVDPDTLLISNSGATLGVPKICKIEATFNDGIAAFLGLNPSENAFHYWFWVRMTPVLRLINQGAAQPNLNTKLLSETVIPQCCMEEQAEITRILDERLSAADAMEAEINASLTRTEALRQSILKQAFSGKLVPQDPKDEPASVLLERIKAEKAKAPKAKRKRKATA